MKKKGTQILLVLLFVATLFVGTIYDKYTKIEQKIEQNDSYIGSYIDENDEYTFSNYIFLAPDCVRTLLLNNGWCYILSTSEELKELAVKYGYEEDIIGLTIYSEHKIYISNERIDTVIHEMFHAVDCILDFPSKTDEALTIYADEKETFLSTFPTIAYINTSSSCEYFAEAFQQYVFYGDALQESCPKTYVWIEKILSKCENE